MINSTIFQQSDLNVSKQFVYTHNLNTQIIAPVIIDNDGINQTTVGVFSFGDENGNDPNNKITLSIGNDITGIWNLQLIYNGTAETLAGKRLFEQSEKTYGNININDRFALGKALTSAYNITVTTLINFLKSATGLGNYFFKIDNNLSEGVPATMRSNLNVYSTTEIANQMATKASLYQLNSGASLGVDNTQYYLPTNPYNPATKSFCENYANDVNFALLTFSFKIDGSGDLYDTTLTVIKNYRNWSWVEPDAWVDKPNGVISIGHSTQAGYASLVTQLYTTGVNNASGASYDDTSWILLKVPVASLVINQLYSYKILCFNA